MYTKEYTNQSIREFSKKGLNLSRNFGVLFLDDIIIKAASKTFNYHFNKE